MSTKDPLALRKGFKETILSHDYSKGPLLILAGPGTGKTFSLIETIRTQVDKGNNLSDFFVTTLTNAAAGDFESEVKLKLSADFKNVSTLHFRAKGIIHRYAEKVGLHSSFLVLTDLETSYILKEIQYNLSSQKKIKAKEVGSLLAQHEEELANNRAVTANDFVLAYKEAKRFYNVIDWYEVPYIACKILSENGDVLQKEISRQAFILVDEYQDLNKAEQDLINLISDGYHLLVVGDDDQSIYGGRYADPSGIVNFTSLYRGVTRIPLSVCSRCPTAIIKVSYSLINKNDPKKREVKPELIALPETDKNADGGYIVSVGLKSAKAEAAFVGDAIKSIIQNNPCGAKDIMILCASRLLGLELMKAIANNHPDIPIQDNLTKEEGDITCMIVSYLTRFLTNHYDNLALRMFLGLFFEISPKAYSVIFNAAKNKVPLWEVLQQIISREELKKERGFLEKFISTVNAVKKQDIYEKLRVFSQEYLELKTVIEQLIISQKECGVVNESDESRSVNLPQAIGVQFMTMHRSKGLDAKYIFIPFLEEEVRLPARDIEEQRRLLYVAIVRARVSVALSWAFSRQSASRHKAGGGGFMKRRRSNFINECGITRDTLPDLVLNRLSQLAKLNR